MSIKYIVILTILLVMLIYKFKKNIKDKIKKFYNNIYRIKISNIIVISAINIVCTIIFELLREILPNVLNVHLCLNFDIDYIAIYSCVLSLVLPLAIMLIEKINSKKDYILVETYLKNTMMFPFIIYFCTNLALIAIIKDQYYFIAIISISIFFILFMYYKTFKLLSDLRYEQEKTRKTRLLIINEDLRDQIKQFDDTNIIKYYLKYGIKVEKYNYLDVCKYEKKNIYPFHDLRKIEQYNYKMIDKIVKKLKIINKEYINLNLNNNIKDNKDVKPKVVISILDIGATIQRDKSCITIYYNPKYESEAQQIMNLISEKIYITSEINNHFYIKTNYEYLQKDCIKSINESSASLLSNSLNKYLDIYKDYIIAIRTNIGDYSYDIVYEHTHSFYEPRAYELLKLIKSDIVDYSQVILKQDDPYLMNELISFLYKMILYSYNNKELLSIQYLDNLYTYLNYQSLKLSDNIHSYRKIQLELFEFIGLVEFDIRLNNMDFAKDVLLVCNHTINSILFDLNKKNEKYFFQYLRKIFKFINDIKDELEEIQCVDNESNLKMSKVYKEILTNYNCNFFATLSYIVNKWEKDTKDIRDILNVYNSYSVEDLTNLLLETINKDYNDKTYSWDLLEDYDLDEVDGMRDVNTTSYLIHLYSLLLNKRNTSSIELPHSYLLSTYADRLIKEFEKLNNSILINKINELLENISEEEKKYIRNTPIDLEKVELFKNKFIENYYKHSELYRVLNSTKNIKRVKNRKRGRNYIGLNNIVDKTYFLSKMPNDRTIKWVNFEEEFANAFIRSEENKYSNLLEEKSTLVNSSIIFYFENNNINYSNFLIFADHSAIHTILHYSNISYGIPNNIEYRGLKSLHYFNYKDHYIPIFSINGLEEKYIYLFNKNELGKIEKYCDDFEIEVKDFYNNNKLLEKFMSTKVDGLDLQENERKNHLLESVNIYIREYVNFDSKKMKGIKFKK